MDMLGYIRQKAETRIKRIERVHNELLEGKRLPCCWPVASTVEITNQYTTLAASFKENKYEQHGYSPLTCLVW